jgi:hypothetical protein
VTDLAGDDPRSRGESDLSAARRPAREEGDEEEDPLDDGRREGPAPRPTNQPTEQRARGKLRGEGGGWNQLISQGRGKRQTATAHRGYGRPQVHPGGRRMMMMMT